MKNTKIKFLTFITFIIFFLPFLQTCSSNSIEKSLYTKKYDTEGKRYDVNKNNYSSNAYMLASSIDGFDFDEFSNYGVGIYFIIIIISIVMFILSIKEKNKIIAYLGITNLSLLFISTIILYFTSIIEEFSQIKFGFYIYIVNLIIIIKTSFETNMINESK